MRRLRAARKLLCAAGEAGYDLLDPLLMLRGVVADKQLLVVPDQGGGDLDQEDYLP